MSTYNEERYIDRCLDRVLGQDYPDELVTVWLVDGGSTDRTVDLVQARAAEDPRLRVFADGRRLNLPEALNIAIEASSGDLLAKIDAHGYPEPDFLSRAVEAFAAEDADVACVGGRPEMEGETLFGRAVARSRQSRFGVGGSVYAGTAAREFVDSVQCGVYRRPALVEVGCFDPRMNYGEDEEVNWRLRQAGYRILLDAGIRFHYVARPSWRSAYRQYRNYGEARVRVVESHPGYLRPRHLAPAALTLGAGALGAGGLFSRRLRTLLVGSIATYSLAAFLAAVRASRGTDLRLSPVVMICFPALHFGYGIGTLRGLWRLMQRSTPRGS
jgi:glycosyltransferase involved in cell wall biosynthesis